MTEVINKQKFLEMQKHRVQAKLKPTVDLIAQLFNDAVQNEKYAIKEQNMDGRGGGIIFEGIVPNDIAVSFAQELTQICARSESEMLSTMLKQHFIASGWGGFATDSLSLKEVQFDQSQTQLVLHGYVYF